MAEAERVSLLARKRAEQVVGELRTIRAGRTQRDRLRIARILSDAHLRMGRGRHLTEWLPRNADPPKEVSLASGVTLLVRRADAIALYEQFGLDLYGFPLPGDAEPHTILDLGANVGFAAVALSRRYPRARLVCAEPVPETRCLLEANLQANAVPATVFGLAIMAHRGWYARRPWHFPGGDEVVAAVDGELEGVPLVELLDRAELDSVDLMKVDIEGAERSLFAAAPDWAGRVRTLVAELHDGFTTEQAEEMLVLAGYRPVKLPSGLAHHALVCFTQA